MSSNHRSLKIVYMGTPEFAVPPLEALAASQHEIVGVVTVADKPAGRGRKIQESAVKKAAKVHGYKILQPTNLKDDEFISELSDLQADLFVVVAFRMLPKMVWAIPELGTFNLHGSLLPKYRGAAPIHWAIINGDDKTGLTTFLLDEKIDTGNIVLQREQEILPNMTTGELHDALLPLGADMVLETANTIAEGTFTALPQEERLVSHAPKLNKENSRLDFSKSPKELVAQIHGLNPFPGAYFGDIKFFRAALTQEQNPSATPKLDVRNKLLMLDYKKGSVQIRELKPSGKRLMSATDFINGMKTNQIEL
jgi:methionyl-tRNA formyltransferase